MSITEQLLQRSVAKLGLGDLTEQEAEFELRKAAVDIVCELLREYVRDGSCSVRVTLEGVPRGEWEELPYFLRQDHRGLVKTETVAPRRVEVEYVSAPEPVAVTVVRDGLELVREVAS